MEVLGVIDFYQWLQTVIGSNRLQNYQTTSGCKFDNLLFNYEKQHDQTNGIRCIIYIYRVYWGQK